MVWRSLPRGGVTNFAGPFSGQRDELLHIPRGKRGMHREHEWRSGNEAHRSKIALRVVRHLSVDRDVEGNFGDGTQEKRITVRSTFSRDIGSDHAGCSAAVVNDDALAEFLVELP